MKRGRSLEILTAAREKIRSGWCKHYYATDKDGIPVDSDSTSAANFCAIGSISSMRVTPEEHRECAAILRSHLPRYAGDCMSVQTFNDSRDTTRLKILGLFGRAIKALESSQ